MNSTWWGFLVPPVTVFNKGSAVMCTGPITVFWLTAIVSLFYGFEGGPLADGEVNWLLVALGVLLWAIAVVWARLVVAGVEQDASGARDSTLKTQVDPERYTADPMDELKK